MLRRLLFTVFFISALSTQAQRIKSQATLRLLETAGTLMEAQQFDAAEEYFKKGLDKARANNDIYCMAVAHKGLGNLYTKTEQPKLAIAAYEMAIKEYRNQ